MSHDSNVQQVVSGDRVKQSSGENELQDQCPVDLAQLFDRCRNDLVLTDSVLSEMEKVVRTEFNEGGGSDSSSAVQEALNARERLGGKIAALGAASIHRMASDIEDLYRTPHAVHVQAMLDDLQARMAHCLKLIPATDSSVTRD